MFWPNKLMNRSRPLKSQFLDVRTERGSTGSTLASSAATRFIPCSMSCSWSTTPTWTTRQCRSPEVAALFTLPRPCRPPMVGSRGRAKMSSGSNAEIRGRGRRGETACAESVKNAEMEQGSATRTALTRNTPLRNAETPKRRPLPTHLVAGYPGPISELASSARRITDPRWGLSAGRPRPRPGRPEPRSRPLCPPRWAPGLVGAAHVIDRPLSDYSRLSCQPTQTTWKPARTSASPTDLPTDVVQRRRELRDLALLHSFPTGQVRLPGVVVGIHRLSRMVQQYPLS